MNRLNRLAKTNVGHLDRMFAILEDVHPEALDKDYALCREYAEVCELLENFSSLDENQQELIAFRAVALTQRVKVLLNQLYGLSVTIH